MTKRVLFVDDEHRVLEGLRRMLRDLRGEWEMSFAASADEAMRLLLKSDYDAVISDVNMPVKDGFDLLRAIRSDEHTRDIPVVILTGNAEQGLKRRALDMGATDLLNKPADREDLIARIENVVRLKRYQDRIKQDKATLELRVRERTAELERSRMELIWRLGKAGEFRDTDTGNHVVRVGYYALELANALGLDPEFGRRLFVTAPLHDLGKIGIPDAILLKPGKLTPAEWDVMKQHTRIGAKILRENVFNEHAAAILGDILGADLEQGNPLTEMGASIAMNHHERWDGSGYPAGIEGEEIPIEARITTLADVYDALSSKRPYKEAFPEEKVLHIMRQGVGTQFDPEAFATFERSLDAFRRIGVELADDTAIHSDLRPAVEELEAA